MSALGELRFMPYCSPLSVPHQIEQKKKSFKKASRGSTRLSKPLKDVFSRLELE